MDKIQLVKDLMDRALEDHYDSLAWYEYIVLPIWDKYRLPMDGCFATRQWWFVLRTI